MSDRCTNCGSYAINEHTHGRTPGILSDLCDVCYWMKIASDRLDFLERLRTWYQKAEKETKEANPLMGSVFSEMEKRTFL